MTAKIIVSYCLDVEVIQKIELCSRTLGISKSSFINYLVKYYLNDKQYKELVRLQKEMNKIIDGVKEGV